MATGVSIARMMVIAELDSSGLSPPEIAAGLGIPVAAVKRALADDRMPPVVQLMGADINPLQAARARYRVLRAQEIVEASMDGDDRWLAFQAAQHVLASEERRQEKTQAVEVVVSSAFLQEPVAVDAEMSDTTGLKSHDAEE
ncbi:MAG: hypothetical protein RR893_11110 [Clostridia bacterium]